MSMSAGRRVSAESKIFSRSCELLIQSLIIRRWGFGNFYHVTMIHASTNEENHYTMRFKSWPKEVMFIKKRERAVGELSITRIEK